MRDLLTVMAQEMPNPFSPCLVVDTRR
jgi:hypothetical protein